MVHFSLPTLALLALGTVTGAVPTPEPAAAEPFSFENWVNGIIADPEGPNLTPSEAIEAALNSTAADSTLSKRDPSCVFTAGARAFVGHPHTAVLLEMSAVGD